MSPNLIGALMFLALGVFDYFFLGYIHDKQLRAGTDPKRLRALNFMRHLQLILFPIAGFIGGPDIVEKWGD